MIKVRNLTAALLVGLPALAGATAMTIPAPGEASEPSILAIARFDFRDTSGEIRDQGAEHRKRLDDVAATLLAGFSGHDKVRPIALSCRTGACSARTSGVEELSAEASSAGATLLLVGEVHKMSTLVGWMKFAVLDLRRRKAICDRFLTYRGDTDEAWHRAARFAVRDIERNCLP